MPAKPTILRERYALKLPAKFPEENRGYYTLAFSRFTLVVRFSILFMTVFGLFLVIGGINDLVRWYFYHQSATLPTIACAILLLPMSGYLIFMYLRFKSSQKLRLEVSPWPLEVGQPFTLKMTLLDKKIKLPIVKLSCMEIFVENSGESSTVLKEVVLETTVGGGPVISCLDGSRLWTGSGDIPPKAPASFSGNSNFIEWTIKAMISETLIETPLVYKVPVVIPEMAQVIHG